jgi:hypothetical protein
LNRAVVVDLITNKVCSLAVASAHVGEGDGVAIAAAAPRRTKQIRVAYELGPRRAVACVLKLAESRAAVTTEGAVVALLAKFQNAVSANRGLAVRQSRCASSRDRKPAGRTELLCAIARAVRPNRTDRTVNHTQ